MSKPTIQYEAAKYSRIEVGKRALVFVLKSPRTGNASMVSTSLVINRNYVTGRFTTMNSKYVPSMRSQLTLLWNIICRR